MIPTYDYSLIRYRTELDLNYKGQQDGDDTKGQQEGDKNNQQPTKKISDKEDEENQAKQKLERKKLEIKMIIDNMRFMQNNIADRKTQNFVQQVEEKFLVDDFLNKFEYEEMQRNYNDYNLGDLLLIFLNPDREDNQKFFSKQQYTKFTEAEAVYDNYLKVLSENGFSQSQLVQERKAFLYAFLMLDNYVEKVDPNKQKELERKKQEQAKKKIEQSKLEKLNSQKKKKNGLNQNQKDHLYTENADEENQLGGKNEKKKEKSQWEIYQEEYNKFKLMRQNMDGEFTGFNLIEEQYLTDILMEVPLNEKAQFKDVKKKFFGGGFLQMYQDDPMYQIEWLCKNEQPRDFLTLVRFTIQTKLSRNANFHTRCFISESGEDIYMVLKGNEKDFDKEAEESGLTKQLELGYSDLLSLEPCDSRYRPLRLKKQIQSCVNEILKDKNFSNKEQVPDFQQAKTLRNFRRIEDRTKMLYDVVKKWNNDFFWTNLALKQIKVNKFMDELSEKLNINRDNEKAEILDDDDENTTREQWEAYYVYLDYLMYFQKKMQHLHRTARGDVKEKMLRKFDLVSQNEAFLYKLIFRKALGDTNEVFHLINGSLSKNKILMNIWDRLETRPISAYVDYFETINDKDQFIWRRYEVNEKKNRSKYLNMEKIKLTYSMAIKQVNLDGLQKSKLYLKSFMAVHDPYQLQGNIKAPLFNKLIISKVVEEEIVTDTETELRELFKLLEDEAEGADFDAESVSKETEFNVQKPWELQIDSLRDYFGEKLALYFKFVQFFTFHLSYLGVIGIFIQILKIIIISDQVEFYLNIFFAGLITIWSTIFVEFWKRQQILFSIEFGQQDFEEDEAERPEFIGTYQRSFVNDKINEKYFSPVKRRMIMVQVLFNFFFAKIVLKNNYLFTFTSLLFISFYLIQQSAGMGASFFIIFLVVLVMYQIFTYRQQWTNNPPSYIGKTDPSVITNIMNSVSILVFTNIYNVLANYLNKVENHKILSSYENSFIAKLFLFQFFNTFNSLILIAFFNNTRPFDTLGLCATSQKVVVVIENGQSVKKTIEGEKDCFAVLETQIITIFLTMIIKTLLEVVVPFLTQFAMKFLKKKLFSKGEIHPFILIDKEVESQSELNPYMTNDDLDGTVGDYLQLIVKFSFLTLFGLSFPPTYAIAFVNNCMEMQMDKLKLLHLYQRPIPKGASNIGTWQVILDSISFISIFGNSGNLIILIISMNQIENYFFIDWKQWMIIDKEFLFYFFNYQGLIVYTSKYGDSLKGNTPVITFISLLIIFLGIKYFLRFLIPDVPEKALIINKRNQVAVERIIKGFKKGNASQFAISEVNFDIHNIKLQKKMQ